MAICFSLSPKRFLCRSKTRLAGRVIINTSGPSPKRLPLSKEKTKEMSMLSPTKSVLFDATEGSAHFCQLPGMDLPLLPLEIRSIVFGYLRYASKKTYNHRIHQLRRVSKRWQFSRQSHREIYGDFPCRWMQMFVHLPTKLKFRVLFSKEDVRKVHSIFPMVYSLQLVTQVQTPLILGA
jgi:hypothetical protein